MCARLHFAEGGNVVGYVYSAGRFRFRLRFRESAPVGEKRIVQADSGSDSDSESRLQSAQSVVQADSVSDSDSESRLHSAQSVVQADSGSDSNSETRRQSVHRMSFVGGAIQTVLSQTIYRNDFLILFPTLGIGVGT